MSRKWQRQIGLIGRHRKTGRHVKSTVFVDSGWSVGEDAITRGFVR